MHNENRLATLSLLFFSLLSIILLALPLSTFVRGTRTLFSYIFVPFIHNSAGVSEYLNGIPVGVVNLIRTEDENRYLRQRIKTVDVINAQNAALVEENARLSAMLSLQPQLPWKGVWGRVIDRDPSRWYSSVTINVGSRNGLTQRSCVVAVQGGKVGLVGKVLEVYGTSAKVLLITDVMSAVTATMPGLGWNGLVEGQGREFVKMNYMPVEVQFQEGPEIVTSAASPLFPPGISIGRIDRVHGNDDFLTFASAEVVPTVHIGGLSEVFVITGGGR